MSKISRVVGAIAGVVAIVGYATGNPGLAGAATAVAALSSTAAQIAQKKPPMRGSTSTILIGANLPMPYAMGRTYASASLIYDVGYGGTDNPYRSMVFVWSGAGPIKGIEAFQSDFATVAFDGGTAGKPAGNATGYYRDFLRLSTQLGATPEAAALAGPFGAIPAWGAGQKLSGYAAGLVTATFDKKGKRFASGLPQLGAIVNGVLVYDPRQDGTYPGGSGACRPRQEATYVWDGPPLAMAAGENPGCHGVTYAMGRHQGPAGKMVFGCGFAPEAIDWPAWVRFMNLCDMNGWKIGGTIFEPGSKWDNLKRICAAGGGEPVFAGGKLSVKFNEPRIALDTITRDDLADGEVQVQAMKGWRDRVNAVVPRYRSEAHRWDMVQAAAVKSSAYIAEDGEEKVIERPFDLVQDKDQAARLAAYELVNGREIGPIILPCKLRLIEYRIGDALTVDLPDEGLDGQPCVIVGRRIDPVAGMIELTLESETAAKHAFALGQTGIAPPTPSLLSAEQLDAAAEQAALIALQAALRTSTARNLTVEGRNGPPAQIELSGFQIDYTGFGVVSVAGPTVLNVSGAGTYYLYADADALGDAAPVIGATTNYPSAFNSAAAPRRVFLGQSVVVPGSGSPPTGGTGSGGGYGGGSNP
ncbi:hypothetical protein [Allosphingosinicella indica]|uniref:Tip attachment protein J domain-containing protein n=1 Tax=Allosphingosinicella indica TaxID=941907 RepID=A0A1X7GJ79_9SPHN|nr:hypothetical protein [Allosphingosinicella indica]SMF70497.1 hypothetical protein SAMN06295910_1885 [Allosphingosinicella indica]